MLHIPKCWGYKSILLLNVLEIALPRNKEIHKPFSAATSNLRSFDKIAALELKTRSLKTHLKSSSKV